jgi:hypothetical protein
MQACKKEQARTIHLEEMLCARRLLANHFFCSATCFSASRVSPDSGLSIEPVLHRRRVRVLPVILDGGIVFHKVGQTHHHLDSLSPAVADGGFGRRGHVAQLYAQASSWPTGIALHPFLLFVRFIRLARGRAGRIDVFVRERGPINLMSVVPKG